MIKKIQKKQKSVTATSVAGSRKSINALLEIGLEEVPSRFMSVLLADIREKAGKELESLRLSSRSIQTFGTPRRLVLYLEGLPHKQEDLQKEVRGPQRAAAYNGNGNPTPALLGFAKSQGVPITELKIKKVGDKEFVFANVTEKGKSMEYLLEQMFPRLIRALYLPISMKWGCIDYRFIRPIHWITATCGSSRLNFTVADVASSNKTCGHRLLSGKQLTFENKNGTDIKTFKALLAKNCVMLDQDERREEIKKMVSSSAKKAGGTALLDPDLLEEVNFLVEWPNVVTGSYKKEFLALPRDVLITTMKKHQKYFAVIDDSGRLVPAFVNITNGTKGQDLKDVSYGNERVLAARLNDAKFFFDEDRKKFLADRTPGLANVAFYEKLGNMKQKVDRITVLSEWISKELKLPDQKRANIREISQLCKSDLLTQMVYELPELQGIMGREYALLEGKPADIANGLAEHYLPRSSGDVLPRSIEGAIVAIADKIDSITGCFSIGIIPTGSEDPFGLRRQAQGIVSIILEKKLNLELDILIERSYGLYENIFKGDVFASGKIKNREVQKVIPDALGFLASRMKSVMTEKGIRYDVADAVLAVFDDPLDSYDKAVSISKNLKATWFPGIVATADRVRRLAVNATRGNVVEADLATDTEKDLYQLCLDVNGAVSQALAKDDHDAALKEYSRMTDPVENFFNKVMVMDKDERLKANRLALLRSMERMFLEYADFSKMVM